MADNRLQLEIVVETGQANASIQQVNARLADFERTALRSARGASSGLEGVVASARDAATATGGLWRSVAAGATIASGLTAAFQKLASAIKSATADAVMLAARVDVLGVALHAVARANGLSTESVDLLVERIKQLGITTQAAREAVARMIAAHLDLAKATELARLAQDAAVISGQNSSEALQGIVHGIVTQQTEVLRTYGIIVQFDRAFTEARRKLGRDLTEVERRNVALMEVLKQAPTIAGAYEAAMTKPGKQLTSLARYAEEAKLAIGERFQPELEMAVKALTALARWVQENSRLLTTFARVALAGSLAVGLTQIIKLLWQARSAANTFTLALVRSPWGAVAVGLGMVAGSLWDYWSQTRQATEAMAEFGRESARADEILRRFRAGATLEELKKLGYSADEIRQAFLKAREAVAGAQEQLESPWSGYLKIINERELRELREQEARKLAEEIAKFRRSSEREAAEWAARVSRQVGEGTAAAIMEALDSVHKMTTYVDEKGIEHQARLTAAAHAAAQQAYWTAAQRERAEWARKEVEQLREENQRRLEFHAETLRNQLAAEQQFLEERLAFTSEIYQHEERMASLARERELAALRSTAMATLEERLAAEQKRAEIEIAYLKRVHEIRMRAFDEETQRLLEMTELRLRASGLDEARVRDFMDQLRQERETLRQMRETELGAEIEQVQREAAARQAELIQEDQRRIFENLKRQAEGVFDALLTRSKSVWQAIADAFKTAVLTAVKEIVTSHAAAVLMRLFAGMRVSFAGGMGALAAVPAMGAASGVTAGAASTGAAVELAGAGAAYGVARAGLGGLAPALGVLGSMFGLRAASTGRAGVLSPVIGAVSGLVGFGALASFFPVLVSAGPLGWVAAAGAGALAGLIGLFRKSAEEKAREKIRATYGVDIRDKNILRQIVETAKQTFGGNLDVAIRSAQVRELIELYAMSTGQPFGGIVSRVTPVALSQSGGVIYREPAYQGGTVIASGGPVAKPSVTVVNITMPAEAVNEAFNGRTQQFIVRHPETVQSAAAAAARASYRRRELAALLLNPNTVLA